MKNETREIIAYEAMSGISVTHENAPCRYPAHWHNSAEFTVVLKDGCRYMIGDVEYRAKKGDILLVWPREIHEIVSIPKGGNLFIQFIPHMLENNTDLISISRLMTGCHIIRADSEPELTDAIACKIRLIEEEYKRHEQLSESRCKLIAGEIILLIGEYVVREQKEQFSTDHVTSQAWGLIRTICNYIAEHSAEDLTEAEVAEAAGLSRHYFSRLFARYMQTSFPSYLSAVRVRTAIRLLADEDLSITECAYNSGFQSTTTFNRVFRNMTGFSPREYRKLHRA